MGLKTRVRPRGEVTHLDVARIHQMRSAVELQNSLPAGSKNRLMRYQHNLSVTRGAEKPLFDSKVKDMLLQYAKDRSMLEATINYLNGLKDADGYSFSRDLKIYSSTSKTFEKFSSPDYTSFRWNQNYRKALEDVRKILLRNGVLTPLNYTCSQDIIDALPKTDTHSGWTWIETGFKEKGDNMENIFHRFEKELAKAKSNRSMNKPILVGFRTQASGEFEDDGTETNTCKHKTRVVCMVDLMQIILELKYAKPVQQLMANSVLYAGGKNPQQISTIINNAKVRNQTWWSIDYSGYDMTISSWLIEDAFDVLKSIFKRVDDDEWEIIVKDFIHKDFIVNEGIVHADKGVPSGSMFTQIIDSIVNCIVVMTYFNSIHAKCEMIAMGDDNLIFCNLPVSQLEDLSSYLAKNFGLETSAAKSSKGTRRDTPEFLSRFWRVDGQWRHPKLLISRMLFPERFRDYSGAVGPEHVIHAFILTYRLGMGELIDVWRFRQDHPISRDFVWNRVDSRYLPGAMAYIREYT